MKIKDLFKNNWINDTKWHRRHKTKQVYQIYQGCFEYSGWENETREEYFISLAKHVKKTRIKEDETHLEYRKALKYLETLK